MNTKPFKHQIEAADFADKHDLRVLIAHAMGGGKGLSALLCASRHPEKRPIVIVCPASLKYMWEGQCAVHFNWRAEIVGGIKPHRTPLPSRPKIVIVNYDVLYAWVPLLKELKPQIVILDETQVLGSRASRRTRAATELCRGVPHVLALSGTPLTNRPEELWPTLHILRPDLFPAFWPFAHAHCNARRTRWGWDTSGASRLPELHAKLVSTLMHRRRKAEMLDLPPIRRTIVPMELENPDEYAETRDAYLDYVGGRSPSKLDKEKQDRAKGMLFAMKHQIARLKLPSVFGWLDAWRAGSEDKLIAFGIHRETIVEAIHKRYEKNSSLITGKVVGKKRQLAFDRFLKDKACQFLAGNLDAAGVGLSAKGVSNNAFVELPWAPAKISQGESRTHGIGRGEHGKESHSWFLVAKGTLEEKLLEILQRKQRNVDKILDGGQTEDPFVLFDELTEMLRNER